MLLVLVGDIYMKLSAKFEEQQTENSALPKM